MSYRTDRVVGMLNGEDFFVNIGKARNVVLFLCLNDLFIGVVSIRMGESNLIQVFQFFYSPF